MSTEDISPFYSKPRALTAAQKKKLRKKQELNNEERRIQAECENSVNLGKEEEDELRRQLDVEGKKLVTIPGDGNCMFRAVEYQLKEAQARGRQVPQYDHIQLRQLVVKYMKQKSSEFEVFMYSLSEDQEASLGGFDAYCEKIAMDGEWGGELELRALSDMLSCTIAVYKRGSKPVLYVGSKYQVKLIENLIY